MLYVCMYIFSLRLFCTVTEFSRKNLSLLFPSAKHPSSKVLSPGDDKTTGEGGRVTDLDNSWTAAKCILALLQAIIQAIDFRYMELQSMGDYSEVIGN